MDYIANLWLIITLIKFASCIDPPDTDGCKKEFNNTGCAFNVYCLNTIEPLDVAYASNTNRRGYYVNPNRYDYDDIDTSSRCSADLISIDSNNYFKIHLVYKDTILIGESEEIPRSVQNMNYYSHIYSVIELLDLSGNKYNVCPNLRKMNKLKFLNLTQNFLTVAKLSNPTDLPALIGIDFSHNTINTIEIDHTESSYKNLIIINLSNNYLVSIPDAVFDTFTQLLTLDLSHNFIDILSVTTFEGIKKLQHLYLSHNRIFDINYSLFRFSDLQVLDLSYNRIEFIKFRDFEKLTRLMTIDLSGNSIKNIENDVFSNMKFLHNLNLNRNMLEIIDKNAFTNASQLETLDISKNHFQSLPPGLFKGKNILYFDVGGNYLEGSILKGTFEGLQLVNKLDLSDQRLTVVGDYAFLGLAEMTSLLLNKNKLETLSKQCFKTLNKLNTLDLSDNIIADINFNVDDLVNLLSLSLQRNYLTLIKQKYFIGLTSLQYLDLSNNKITNLESNAFLSLRDLINLDLSNNPLSGILKGDTFIGLHSLPSLDISCTELTSIENSSFTGMAQLAKVNVSHSNISEIQYNSFISTGLIETLDLSFNELTTFQVNATDLIRLKILLLQRNFLKQLPENSFLGLISLTTINLAHNSIKSIHANAFINQEDLSCLDISYNIGVDFSISVIRDNKNLNTLSLSGIKRKVKFTGIHENQLTKLNISYSEITNITNLDLKELERLESLIMSNNNIAKLESAALSNVIALSVLDLSYNKITYIQPGVFKDNEHLFILNISHNLLTTVSYGIFRGLINLNTLNLSFNNINTLENERFYEVQSLKTLIVDHNNIRFVNVEEFRGTSLTELSIGENPIPCEILIKLKQYARFRITAINIDEMNAENVDGIICNMYGFTHQNTHNDSLLNNNENILINIRDTLHKIVNKNFSYTKTHENNDSQYFLNLTQAVTNIGNDYNMKATNMMNTSIMIMKESADTNVLLEKILRSLSRVNLMTSPLTGAKDNATKLNEVIQYIDSVKHDLEEAIYSEKKNVLDEVEKKMSATTSEVVLTTTSKPSHEMLLASESSKNVIETRPSLFTDTCVALILLILVCFILYKFYKSRMFVRASRTYSTRELPGAMESQDL